MTTRRKAQFFIVSAVILLGILFFTSQLLLDAVNLPVDTVESDPGPATFHNIRNTVERVWWNASFDQRTPLTVTERSGAVLRNVIVEADLPARATLNGCEDLRVVERGRLRPFALRTCTGDGATIFLQTNVDADATEQDTVVYYGNPAVDNRSQPLRDLFMHFEDAEDVSEWDETTDSNWEANPPLADGSVYRSQSNPEISADRWTVYRGGVDAVKEDGFQVESRVLTDGNGEAGLQFWHDSSSPERYWMVNMTHVEESLLGIPLPGLGEEEMILTVAEVEDGAADLVTTPVASDCAVDTWCTMTVTVADGVVRVDIDGEEALEQEVTRDGTDVGVLGLHGHTDGVHDFDNVTLRNVVDPLPRVVEERRETYAEVMERLGFVVEQASQEAPYTVSLQVVGNCSRLDVDSFTYRLTDTVC